MEISKDSVIFWTILEFDVQTKIQDYIKNAFSFRGYGKAFVFQDITEEDICLVQEYVSKELPGQLDTLLKESQIEYSYKKNICFFGSYATSPKTFCFAPGEKKMILKLAQHVRDTVDKQGLQHYADETSVPKKVLSEQTLIETVFGLVFGPVEKQKIGTVCSTSNGNSDQKNILFKKALAVYAQFKKLRPTREFNIDMVQVTVEGDKIKGKVVCIFCDEENSISLYCKSTSNWVMTNLSSHVNKKHLVIVEDQLANSYEKLTIKETQESMAGSSENNKSVGSSCEDNLYAQISAQCIKMGNSVAHNSDKTHQKCLGARSASTRGTLTIKYCRVSANGDCLFLSIAHQLFNVKLGSPDHINKANDLRAEVVRYVKEEKNLPNFIHDLKNRLGSGEAISDISEACKEFLDSRLSMAGCWGGMETIKAISQIHGVNIIVMNENGMCNLPSHYDMNALKTLLLLFGTANGKSCRNNDERTHYDSIVHIHQTKISAIAKEQSEIQYKHEKFLDIVKGGEVIEID